VLLTPVGVEIRIANSLLPVDQRDQLDHMQGRSCGRG
jgi:hypothetical protein